MCEGARDGRVRWGKGQDVWSRRIGKGQGGKERETWDARQGQRMYLFKARREDETQRKRERDGWSRLHDK